MITDENAKKLWDLISPIKVGMLTTIGEGHLHARPLHLVQDKFDGALWFFVDRSSGKIHELADDNRACLSFADHGRESYVCLSGTATIDDNPALIDKFWTPFVGAYFPQGKDDPNLALLRIDTEMAEYWDSTSSRMVQLFKMIKANITKEVPNLGEHRKIS